MLGVANEAPEDWWEVEALFDLAFAPGREALSSYRLREGTGPLADLSLVARDEYGGLGGAVRVWPVRVDTNIALLVGPIAVHPTHQGEGLGGLLMRESLGRARAAGWQRAMLVGDAPYYQRFGFRRLDGVIMPPPTNPDRVLGADLAQDAWDGIAGHVRPWAEAR